MSEVHLHLSCARLTGAGVVVQASGNLHGSACPIVIWGAESPGAPPRAFHRRSPIQTATPIPARMHKAYARMGKGPRCHTPWGGLGMLNGTIKVAVVLSCRRFCWESAHLWCTGDHRTVTTATTAPTRAMRAAAPNPAVTDARWRVSPTELVDWVLTT